MQLSAALGPAFDLYEIFKMGFVPTVKKCWSEPSILLSPHAIVRVFMAAAWAAGFGDGVDQNARPVKASLITPRAYGCVLDLGAGHGHSAPYFDRTKVTRYIALEPNTNMHPQLRKTASEAGFHESDGTFVILSCGAEDSAAILSALDNVQVDTVLSILTLCTVPNPEKTIHNLVRDVLKPGGVFLFYEHVLSHHKDVAWWQRLWAPIWAYPLDGCRLDRPTHLYMSDLKIEGSDGVKASPWKERELRGKPGEVEKNLFWHRVGRFVKN